MEHTATTISTISGTGFSRESCFIEDCQREVMYKCLCPWAGCPRNLFTLFCEEHAAERRCPSCGAPFVLEPPHGHLVKPPLSHIGDGADFEFSQDEADGPGRPCILLDLRYTLFWSDWQDFSDLGDRVEGKLPDDFRREAGASLHLRPYALELLRWLLERLRGGECSLGFLSTWTPENMWVAVRFLLESATEAPWTQGTANGVAAQCEQEPWKGLRVFMYDESYTETDLYGYLSKDFEKVLASWWDQPVWRRLTIYITCSDECMWNGKENVVIVHPYEYDDSSDCELRELSEYVKSFLAQSSGFDVRAYLRSHKFTSTAQRHYLDAMQEQHEIEADWRPMFQLVKEQSSRISLPPALNAWQRKVLHDLAESVGLHHESSGFGEFRFLQVWFEAGS